MIPHPAVVDRTTAPVEVFDVALAGWEAREADPDGAVEKVARALWESQPGTMPWAQISELTREVYRRRAPQVIHAMQPPASQVNTAAAVECTCGEYYDLQCAAHGDAR